jgi:transcriptional regulator with XRE-family HTH domain
MKFKEKYNISRGYEHLFSFSDEKEELAYEAHMLMFRFLSEVEKIHSEDNTLKNKDLASKLDVSPSYITQLFKGDKLLNFTMLAKIQKVYNITFEIKARKSTNTHSPVTTKKKIRSAPFVNQLSEGKIDYNKA